MFVKLDEGVYQLAFTDIVTPVSICVLLATKGDMIELIS